MLLHERQIEDIIEGVVARVTSEIAAGGSTGGTTTTDGACPAAGTTVPAAAAAEGTGIFESVEEALEASKQAASEFARLSLDDRRRIEREMAQVVRHTP